MVFRFSFVLVLLVYVCRGAEGWFSLASMGILVYYFVVIFFGLCLRFYWDFIIFLGVVVMRVFKFMCCFWVIVGGMCEWYVVDWLGGRIVCVGGIVCSF